MNKLKKFPDIAIAIYNKIIPTVNICKIVLHFAHY